MKVKPEEPDLDALKAAFDAQPGHARLRALKTLHDQSQLLVWRTIKELRKFVMNKDEEVCHVLYLILFPLFVPKLICATDPSRGKRCFNGSIAKYGHAPRQAPHGH